MEILKLLDAIFYRKAMLQMFIFHQAWPALRPYESKVKPCLKNLALLLKFDLQVIPTETLF